MNHRLFLLLLLSLVAACGREPVTVGHEDPVHDAHGHDEPGHDEHDHDGTPGHDARTTIPADVARDSGIEVEVAGAALIRDTIQVMGTVAIDASRHARVTARFPGIVREVRVQEGQRVRRGDPLALVEGNDSLRTYAVTAPIDGVVLARHASVGDLAGEMPLVELADLSQLWVDLRAIGRDAARLRAGQAVRIRSATSDATATGVIARMLPVATAGQGVIARVHLPNPDGQWRPGMTVTAEVTISAREVPLAVRESALQVFRGATVVFAQDGDTYEARELELGVRDGEHAQVLAGLQPGTRYVVAQSYLIRADIEKSGAGHQH